MSCNTGLVYYSMVTLPQHLNVYMFTLTRFLSLSLSECVSDFSMFLVSYVVVLGVQKAHFNPSPSQLHSDSFFCIIEKH